jgi:NAD(P)-dependent dehydrogenase (short-subunit alcohol dehydrogenase family)
MAVRDREKGESMAAAIRAHMPEAKLNVEDLDLCSLKSVQHFSEKFLDGYDKLDLLINNAGVMVCPFATTQDHFEIQMGTNHLGHFALTGHLLEQLKSTAGSRVVPVSSIAHKLGKINFDDIHWEKRHYNRIKAYCDSKLANLHFAYELGRKLSERESGPLVVPAHPGVCQTELTRHSKTVEIMGKFVAQKQTTGALSILRAATDLEANHTDYYGPRGFLEMAGSPVQVRPIGTAKNETVGKRLWALSEELTNVEY